MLIRAGAVSVSGLSGPRVEDTRTSPLTSPHTNTRHNYSRPSNTSTLTVREYKAGQNCNFQQLIHGGIRSHIQQFLKTLKSLEMHLVIQVPFK